MLLSLKLFSSPFFNLVIFLTFEMETQKLGMMEITDFSAFLVSNIKFSKLRGFFFPSPNCTLWCWNFYYANDISPPPMGYTLQIGGVGGRQQGWRRKKGTTPSCPLALLSASPQQPWPLIPAAPKSTWFFSILLVQPHDHFSAIYPDSI